MAQISERNPCFRSKDVIVRDIVFVLNSPLAYGTQEAVLRNAMWTWTEFSGKYAGCPYWTKAANIEKLIYLDNQIKGREPPKPKFIHEHAVPKQLVIRMIRALSPATDESVRAICDRFLFGVVATQAEDARLRKLKLHQSMPPGFYDQTSPDYDDAWVRYRQCGIEVMPHPPGWDR